MDHRTGTWSRVLTLVATATLVVAAAACTGSSSGASAKPSGSTTTSASVPPGIPRLEATPSGYVIPAHLPAGPAGTLLAAVAHPEPALGAGQAWQVLYRSVWPRSTGVVSGLVLVPRGKAPAGGWPIVAWAHGTSGLADQCAPSLTAGLADDSTAVAEVRRLLGKGWAVVATDYPGLGTPGVHPYLMGDINGPAVVDSVLAGRQLVPALGRRWMLVGHSEGGQSALFAAQYAVKRAPALDYRGVVALAPASLLEALLPAAEGVPDSTLRAYAIYTVAGLAQVDPSVSPDRLVSAAARPAMADLTGTCDDQLMTHLEKLDPPTMFAAASPAIGALGAEVGRRADPDRKAAPGPVLVLQGTKDNDVPEETTVLMASHLCKLGDQVTFTLFPGQDHGGVVSASWPTVARWITDRFAGTPAQSTC